MGVAKATLVPVKSVTENYDTIQHPHAHSQGKRRRHSHSHAARSKKLRMLQVVTALLVITLVAVIIGWIDSWADLQSVKRENYHLASDLRSNTREVARLNAEVAQLRTDVRTMVRQRLPGLTVLKYDTTFPISDKYVKNMSFTRTGVGGDLKYEYRLVAENRGYNTITPEVKIVLFDKLGIQVGTAEITGDESSSEWKIHFLAPGETRAYTSLVPTTHDATPEYFLISVK